MPTERLPTHAEAVRELKRVLSRNLRAARFRIGLTQAEVSTRARLAEEVYGRMERGRMLPSLPSLLRLARALQASPAELFGQVDTSPAAAHTSLVALVGQLTDTPELRRVLRRLSGAKRAELRLIADVAAATVRRRS